MMEKEQKWKISIMCVFWFAILRTIFILIDVHAQNDAHPSFYVALMSCNIIRAVDYGYTFHAFMHTHSVRV